MFGSRTGKSFFIRLVDYDESVQNTIVSKYFTSLLFILLVLKNEKPVAL